jgi:hypothetical protein
MSEQNAMTGKTLGGLLIRPPMTRATTIADGLHESDRPQTTRRNAAEYWAGRIMWSLVTAAILWDIAVTFGKR